MLRSIQCRVQVYFGIRGFRGCGRDQGFPIALDLRPIKQEKARDPIQDTLALMSGMVSSRTLVVKDRTGDWRGENKGNTIRVLDMVPGG